MGCRAAEVPWAGCVAGCAWPRFAVNDLPLASPLFSALANSLPAHQHHCRCQECNKKLATAKALSVHTLNVHTHSLAAVPGSLEDRGDPAWDIFGLDGIPPGMKVSDPIPPGYNPGQPPPAPGAAAVPGPGVVPGGMPGMPPVARPGMPGAMMPAAPGLPPIGVPRPVLPPPGVGMPPGAYPPRPGYP